MNKSSIIIKLESLLELSYRLNSEESIKSILNSALLSLMGKFKITRGCVFLKENEQFSKIITKGKFCEHNVDFTKLENLALNYKSSNGNSMKIVHTDFHFFLPVSIDNIIIAVICLGNKIDGIPFDETEERYAHLVANISANAITNASNLSKLVIAKSDLENRNQLLTTLFEMSKDFSSLLSKPQIIKMLSLHLMGQLMVNKFAVYLFDGIKWTSIINRFDFDINTNLLSEYAQLKETTLLSDIKNFDGQICVASPMNVQGQTKGILLVGNKYNGNNLSRNDIKFIEALGNTAIASFENERLFIEELEKKKLESELSIAKDIQNQLLPKSFPVLDNYEIVGATLPSRYVGGDYFDFIPIENDKYLICIADVSGKGIPASLIMANVQAALRVLAPLNLDLKSLIIRLNKLLFDNTTSDKFVTLFFAYLDLNSSVLTYINAGHNPPYYFADGLLSELSEGGLILGCIEEPFEYSIGEIKLQPGQFIVMFTDGVTEATNEHKQEFSEKRLKELLLNNTEQTPYNMMNNIFSTVKDFANNNLQYDDITVVVIKRH